MQRTNKDSKERIELFSTDAEYENIDSIKAMYDCLWLMPTDQQRENIKPWVSIPKQKPTMREPIYLADIRECNAKLIKYHLYCYDYTLTQIERFIADSHDLKAQRYDKDKIFSGTSDSTALRAEKTLCNERHNEEKRIARAITETLSYYQQNDETIADFMQKAYQVDDTGKKKYTEAELVKLFSVCRRTICNWKHDITSRVALKLGWEIPAVKNEMLVKCENRNCKYNDNDICGYELFRMKGVK
jgi:hypothetical protein